MYGKVDSAEHFARHNRDKLEHVISLIWKSQQIADEPKQNTGTSDEASEEPKEDVIDSQILTENEVARIQREHDFDTRIKQMKEELALRTPDVPRKGDTAMQLHPHVHNLPHNIISDFYDDLPDVEESI